MHVLFFAVVNFFKLQGGLITDLYDQQDLLDKPRVVTDDTNSHAIKYLEVVYEDSSNVGLIHLHILELAQLNEKTDKLFGRFIAPPDLIPPVDSRFDSWYFFVETREEILNQLARKTALVNYDQNLSSSSKMKINLLVSNSQRYLKQYGDKLILVVL